MHLRCFYITFFVQGVSVYNKSYGAFRLHWSTSANVSLSKQLYTLQIFVRAMQVAMQKTSVGRRRLMQNDRSPNAPLFMELGKNMLYRLPVVSILLPQQMVNKMFFSPSLLLFLLFPSLSFFFFFLRKRLLHVVCNSFCRGVYAL